MDFSDHFFKPKDLVYLDSAASSLTAKTVIEAMDAYYRDCRANIHRGAHRLTREASERYEAVYGKLARFFNASDQEFAAVRNATEAINAVALGMDWKPGDEVIVTDVEHHSNLLPWLRLKEKGVAIRILAADDEGRVSLDSLTPLLSKKTRLVAFTGCSNVLACRVPVGDLARAVKDAGALVLVDAAQSVSHQSYDLKKLPVDFLAFSGHKCFGPTGIGVLFHRSDSGLTPWFLGGGTVRDVTLDRFELLAHRERFEAGTPAVAEFIGLGAALDLVSKFGFDALQSQDKKLGEKIHHVLENTPSVAYYGPKNPTEKACPLYSFNVNGLPHHQVALMLDRFGVCVRSGHHCAMPLTWKLGVEGTVRVSAHAYNTENDVAAFAAAIEKVAQLSG